MLLTVIITNSEEITIIIFLQTLELIISSTLRYNLLRMLI